MPPHRGPLLVDTNAIIECWRTRSWKALSGGYRVETVELCVIETQTGLQKRRPERRIDMAALSATLKAVHEVGDAERARAVLRDPQIAALDIGEQMLWAHALTRDDPWVLCGPDKASLRTGIRLGLRDRLVSLERLLQDVGFRPQVALGEAYTARWHTRTLAALAVLEGGRA
jgi:hypothetical protein